MEKCHFRFTLSVSQAGRSALRGFPMAIVLADMFQARIMGNARFSV
ncbi:hypothetical protein [uncultured Bacteroides sp.]|nr:hypothetical protein [uncultured Bacteroides sp.]MDE5759778.1 hypothetical protein [Bacteroides sp.]